MNMDGRAVANFVLDRGDDLCRPITNLQLQKLVFFCHAWHLVKLDAPLVKHSFEAWKFGPVLQYLYRDFKDFEDRPINVRATKINLANGCSEIVQYSFHEASQNIVRAAVDFYSKLSAGTLVALSHTENGPWHEAWRKGEVVNPGMRISNSQIQTFYSSVVCPF